MAVDSGEESALGDFVVSGHLESVERTYVVNSAFWEVQSQATLSTTPDPGTPPRWKALVVDDEQADEAGL